MRVRLLTLFACLLTLPLPVLATPITYTMTTTASGQLGNATFTNAFLTITMIGDTNNVFRDPAPQNSQTSNIELSIAGLAPATFLSPLNFFCDEGDDFAGLLFSQNGGGGGIVLGEFNSRFATYDLTTTFSKAIGLTNQFFDGGAQILTTEGDFSILSDTGTTSFASKLGRATPPPPAVPEPSTIYLIGTGALGIAEALRRKLRQT
jgi:PEP-CTERM motif